MKMIKLFAAILVLVLCMSLFAGCGGTKEDAKITPQETAESSIAETKTSQAKTEEKSEPAPAEEKSEPALAEEKTEAAPAETEEKSEPASAAPADDVTAESLLNGYHDSADEIESMSFNMLMDVQMEMAAMGQEEKVTMNINLDVETFGESGHMTGSMVSDTYGEKETETLDQYIIMKDGKYVAYSYDKDTDSWSESGSESLVISKEMIPKLDASKFKLEEEGSRYKVSGDIDIKELSESMGEGFGELFSSFGGMDFGSIEGKAGVEYYFSKDTKELDEVNIDMAEAFETMIKSMFEALLSGQDLGEEGASLEDMFKIEIGSFRINLNNILINQGKEIVLPEAIAKAVSDDSSKEEKETSEKKEDSSEKKAGAGATVDGTVLVDQDGIKITTKGTDESYWGPQVKLQIENNTDKDIIVQTRDSSVNGYMMDASMSAEIAAGKKANDSFSISTSDMEAAGISTIADIELKFAIIDNEDWNDIFVSDAVTIRTDAFDGFKYEYDNSGDSVYNENGVEIVVKGLSDDEDSWYGPSITVYISNTSGKNITVSAQNVSVNGFMIDGLLYSTLLDGKHAIDGISFMNSDLEENDIEKIEDVELSFRIYDADSYDTIAETSVISLKF